MKADWMCRDKGLLDLKLRVLSGKWSRQETENMQEREDQAANKVFRDNNAKGKNDSKY